MRARPLFFALLLATAFASGGACDKKEPKVIVIDEEAAAKERAALERKNEEKLREEYEARKAARANQPEPELDPNDPREKWEVVWNRGKPLLDGIYNERAEMIALIRRIAFEDKDEEKFVKETLPRLAEFGLGREVEQMEKFPDELCAIINKYRPGIVKLIETGEEELKKVNSETAELDKAADAGKTIYQRQWDKLDERRKRWSAPVKAGKQMLLIFRSMLDEAHVVADWGPRRAQIKLRDCLTEIGKTPFRLDLTQTALEKTLERSRYYKP